VGLVRLEGRRIVLTGPGRSTGKIILAVVCSEIGEYWEVHRPSDGKETVMLVSLTKFGVAGALAAGLWFGVPAAADANVGNRSVAPAAPAQGGECGKPGQPPCPLQDWMRKNVASALASNDAAALSVALDKAAKLTPDPAWASWVTAASSGAEAAKKGDIAGARAACKTCHDTWRATYREQYRMRPVPR
jgi:hypothetical protein